MTRENSLIRKNSGIFLSAFLPEIILVSVFAKIGIFPFGNGTLLLSDMNTQYVDFMAEYQRILHGTGSLFYSWHAGLGLNFLGLFAYYLSSPFNLLLFFFPEKNLLDAITLITVLKIAGCGLTFSIYLHRHFAARQSGPLLPVFATCYALMGYTVAYALNIMWLDGVLLLPLLCLALDRLLQGRGWTGCVVVFALLFLSNFYIAYMVSVFSVFYFLAGMINASPRFPFVVCLKRCASFAAAVILAAGVSAFLLLPAFFVLKDNMGLIGQSFPAFAMQFPPADLFVKLLLGTYDGLRGNLPHIYSGLLTICLLPLYFFSPGIRKGKKLATSLLMILLVFSFNLAPLDFFWHAFDYPSWFPYRYAFLFSFLLCTAAFEGIFHSEELPRKNLLIWLALLGGALLLVQKMNPERIDGSLFYLNLCFLLFYGILFSIGSIKQPLVQWLLLLLVIAECWLSTEIVFQRYRTDAPTRTAYVEFRDRYRAEIVSLPAEADAFYRIEKTEIRSYNDPLGLGYAGIGHFSSTASVRQSSFLKKLGLDCYATWCTYSGGSIFSDSLLGIRYLLTDQAPNKVYRQISEVAWENPFAFPPAFFADQEILEVDPAATDNPVRFQETLLQAIDPAGDMPANNPESPARPAYFTAVPVNKVKMENLTEVEHEHEDPVYARTETSQPGIAEYETVITSDAQHVLFIPNVSLNYDVWVNDRQVFDRNRNYTPYLVNLGNFSRGETVRIQIITEKDPLYFENLQVYAFNSDLFSAIAENIRISAPEHKQTGPAAFTLSVESVPEGKILLTSIPYDRGWEAKVNGENVPVLPVMDSLVGVEVPGDAKQIELEFVPSGWREGVLISVISLILIVSIAILTKKQRKH